jgi:imidazolonepropionase-like amidohydrolase
MTQAAPPLRPYIRAMPMRLPSILSAPSAERERLWLTDMRLLDGTGAAVREDAAVLVEGGRIAAVGRPGDRPADGVRVVELGGRTLLPGLIDAHSHLKVTRPTPAEGAEPLWPGADAHFLAADLRKMLRRGITTVRDVGSYGDLVLEARQAMRYGAFRGPRILTCGRIVSATSPGGRFFDGMYREADGPDDVRRAVREQLRRGADFIKVMTTGARSVELEDPDPAQLTATEIAALVEEAHRQGYRVAAHAEGIDGTEIAVQEGIDTIEHGMYLHRRPDLLEQMAARGQVLVPTLSCFYGVAGLGDAVGTEGIDLGTGQRSEPARAETTWSPMLYRLAHRQLHEAALTLKSARAAGVRIASGHDWLPFYNSSIEIRRMIAHGLTASEALIAATATNALALGIDDHVGTVTPGKQADLTVIDGDPLEHPQLLTDSDRIWLVIQGGAIVAGSALEIAAGGLAPVPQVV